ncbi:MAG: IclR family transcriptional regulator C-terminal domain-containing protein [Sneathiellaceae bacterium]
MARLRVEDAERRSRSTAGPDFSEALARGMRVIRAFNAEARQMTLSELAKHVDLPRATVRRVLLTFVHLGYVEAEGRQFRLTPKVLDLAAAFLSSSAVSSVLQPTCERITRELGEACSTAVLYGAQVVMIAHAAPPRFIDVGPGVGFRLPAWCTSLGRVLLAEQEPAELEAFLAAVEIEAVTPHTVTDRAGLRLRIEAARDQGHAIVDQEAELGFRSVAVPLRRLDGKAVAALNVGARVEAASVETLRDRFLPVLQREAAALRTQLL